MTGQRRDLFEALPFLGQSAAERVPKNMWRQLGQLGGPGVNLDRLLDAALGCGAAASNENGPILPGYASCLGVDQFPDRTADLAIQRDFPVLATLADDVHTAGPRTQIDILPAHRGDLADTKAG